ncbi:bifunctional protein FolD protein [Paenibacillus larvae subsp. larvae]|uniref:Bifunctional protein FolD n=2 Tax=Paenibacillus larvae TaxID=1464 RepID=A0A1U9YQR9_9BACL|nr:bifunctional methylenetetrahydrofolate dehydrogenase/methenyltetrahydrofolate cyclohydrolase FolD [Paenibacillus larvae]AQT86160.1 bifunctional methylenetetrahydrofolate dehydrogenase/methenyltetrahydrofolate cyclohydrolase [Paenibacillus larvae subsp. pulvifaciens]AQZ47775.1 bifunctional methylenetetrahydrofolate dehydrogenase/methenyltetrahydrofolate cyclohydrolase [Paenibacillus larvae subsp. pulvifaciens]ARF69475.1 bifunctional methylenetetrahydrofolate dehydrogenase/methenyltetrahydrofol
MAGQVINGKELVSSIREEIKTEAAKLTEAGIRPGLAVVIVGDDPASHIYVNNKAKACEQVGIYSKVFRLPEATKQEELLALIQKLNEDNRIHGILVQSPLPSHLNEEEVVDHIDPRKDVDCFHPVNVGNLMIGKPGFLPCTPAGVIEILKRTGIDIAGKHAVVVGRSNIVGKPMALLLLREHATVTVCHSRTPNMEEITRQADILVVAVGKANLIRGHHVKPGAVVIDVGMNRNEHNKLTGDVNFGEAKEICSYITPVPGCVGPMTITMLLKNTLQSAVKHLPPGISE